MENIEVKNCINCTLVPEFKFDIYSYYIIVPDNIENLEFNTTPQKDVTFIIGNPTHLLSEEEKLEKKVNEIISYKVGDFDNPNSMNKQEVEKLMLSFYNKNQIDNNTINQSVGTSSYEWIAEFVNDDTKHNLIEITYKNLTDKLENETFEQTNNKLNAEGLLHLPWTPITIDIHYDLHHWRIFVIRKSGQYDIKQFRKSIEMNNQLHLLEP